MDMDEHRGPFVDITKCVLVSGMVLRVVIFRGSDEHRLMQLFADEYDDDGLLHLITAWRIRRNGLGRVSVIPEHPRKDAYAARTREELAEWDKVARQHKSYVTYIPVPARPGA